MKQKRDCLAKGCPNSCSNKASNYCQLCKVYIASKGLEEVDLQLKHAVSIIKFGVHYNEFYNNMTGILVEKK